MKNVRLEMDGKNVNVRHANQVDSYVKFRQCVFRNAYDVISKPIVLMGKMNAIVQVSIT